jgi:hypothetical protein
LKCGSLWWYFGGLGLFGLGAEVIIVVVVVVVALELCVLLCWTDFDDVVANPRSLRSGCDCTG